MAPKIFVPIILLLAASFAFSQGTFQKGSDYCSYKKMNSPHQFVLGDSPNSPRHKFDVLDYKLNLNIYNCFLSPYPKSFTGSIIVKFRIDTALSQITLNAVNTSLQINSVGMSGVSFTHAGNILTINLDRTYNPNEITQVLINYQHLNVSDQAFYTGNGGVFTDAEPEGARKWFPCWDKPSDKATLDMTVKVPLSVKIGSNGRLNDSLITGDTIYYHWISRDPITTYLTVLTGKVNYNLNIVFWQKISNPSENIPIRFYFNSGENPTSIQSIIGPMTTHFSQKYGEYPFEKNGFATAPAPGFTWGGMENQTLTTLCQNCWSANLVSHEHAHMWFGDMISPATWADIWLNEGFATYSEAIWYEYTGGYSAYKSDINSDASGYLSGNPGWPIYNPEWAINTPPNGTLFNTAITYNKSACILHQLRYLVGDSATFFNIIRSYALDTANFKYKSAATDDFAVKISQAYGQDLTWYINGWVKQPNHPVYGNYYQFNNNGNGTYNVGFQARQTQSNPPFFRMILPLRITFATGPDSVFRVSNTSNNQIWIWTFNRQPLTFSFDQDNDIVLKQGNTTAGTVPGTVGITLNNSEVPKVFSLGQNYPNPFNPVTLINFDIPANAKSATGGQNPNVKLIVYDVLGKVQSVINDKELAPGRYTAEFNATNMASGIYYYRLDASIGTSSLFTDVKKMVVVK